MSDEEGRDIWETVMDDPVVMGGVGALVGNVAGRKVGKRLIDRHRWTRAEHEMTDALRAHADDVYDRRYGDAGTEGGADGHAFDASERIMQTSQNHHPKYIVPLYSGTIGGGAAGAAYAIGKRKQKR